MQTIAGSTVDKRNHGPDIEPGQTTKLVPQPHKHGELDPAKIAFTSVCH